MCDVCYPRNPEMKRGNSKVQGHPWLSHKFRACRKKCGPMRISEPYGHKPRNTRKSPKLERGVQCTSLGDSRRNQSGRHLYFELQPSKLGGGIVVGGRSPEVVLHWRSARKTASACLVVTRLAPDSSPITLQPRILNPQFYRIGIVVIVPNL